DAERVEPACGVALDKAHVFQGLDGTVGRGLGNLHELEDFGKAHFPVTAAQLHQDEQAAFQAWNQVFPCILFHVAHRLLVSGSKKFLCYLRYRIETWSPTCTVVFSSVVQFSTGWF